LGAIRPGGAEDPFAFRVAFELVNQSGPAGLSVQYQTPQPLYYFFKFGRVDRDGHVTDLTQSQIGGMHLGEPQKRELRFNAKGDAAYDRVSYQALASIVPPAALIPGRYRLGLAPFAILTLDGKECMSNIPPMPIELYPDV